MALSQEEFNKLKNNIISMGINTFPEEGYFSRVGESIKRGYSDIFKASKDVEKDVSETGKIGAEQFIRPASRTIEAIVNTGTSPVVELPIVKPAIEGLGNLISNNLPQFIKEYATNNPEEFRTILTGIDVAGLGLAKPITKSVGNVVRKGVDIATPVTESLVETGKKIIEPITDITKTVASAGTQALEGASRIPTRIKTNIAEKQAVKNEINTLINQEAKNAVNEGVDILDIKDLSSLPRTEIKANRNLIKNIIDYADGKTKTNPIETVGQPIANRIKTIKNELSTIGQKLNEVSNNLPTLETDVLKEKVLNRLKQVKGLEDLNVTDEGLLDFADTTLQTSEALADKNAIQSIYEIATKADTGKRKHLLRQGLREELGGKTKAGVKITSTQEESYEAIRKGLADVLDEVSPKYKEINKEYATRAEPLFQLAKKIKLTGEVDDDILNMSAGLLARRLTSNAGSNPEIRNILKNLDKTAGSKGNTLSRVENLQNTLNTLSKYYNIDAKTGFKNLVKEGVEATGAFDLISKSITNVAGKTNTTRKKALENFLKKQLLLD